jgi:hypothetical protein
MTAPQRPRQLDETDAAIYCGAGALNSPLRVGDEAQGHPSYRHLDVPGLNVTSTTSGVGRRDQTFVA